MKKLLKILKFVLKLVKPLLLEWAKDELIPVLQKKVELKNKKLDAKTDKVIESIVTRVIKAI